MKLYLLRHGVTEWNRSWKLQGSTDIPLSEEGVVQAREAAARYAKIPFTAVYSSPLQRALKTAEIVAQPHELPVVPDQRLREMCFGDLEGTTPEEMEENPVLRVARTNFFDHPELYEPVGNGETFEQTDERCRDFLNFLREHHGEQDHILISAHGALCKALMRVINNTPVEDFWHTPPQQNCSVIEIDW